MSLLLGSSSYVKPIIRALLLGYYYKAVRHCLVGFYVIPQALVELSLCSGFYIEPFSLRLRLWNALSRCWSQ